MEYVREVGELRGNQGIEEEECVMFVEPIAMIVLSKMQDLPKTLTPESSASSSAREGGDHHTSSSSSSSSEETPNHEEETGNVVGNEPGLKRKQIRIRIKLRYFFFSSSFSRGYALSSSRSFIPKSP
ncbi:hypothetical protein SLEP1_g36104 [Rubroshorea leprosula]|uniref:Uncharacterized protein n=1 Tax=Rubroshorea leprosula TaxID=152421 RepID=A0AAV5KQI2_9ROSI|nr:hypothetical protein SLEP1_g36104 [Rubroshorea leprosula]